MNGYDTTHKANNPVNWKTFCGVRKPNRANGSTAPLAVDYPASENWEEITCGDCLHVEDVQWELLYRAENPSYTESGYYD